MGHSLLNLDFGIDVPLKRRPSVSSWNDSNTDWPTVGSPIRVAYLLDKPVAVETSNGKVYKQSGQLYVYRGTDVRDGDRVVLPEGDFGVNGPKQLDYVQPMDGHDFGVMRFQIERGG